MLGTWCPLPRALTVSWGTLRHVPAPSARMSLRMKPAAPREAAASAPLVDAFPSLCPFPLPPRMPFPREAEPSPTPETGCTPATLNAGSSHLNTGVVQRSCEDRRSLWWRFWGAGRGPASGERPPPVFKGCLQIAAGTQSALTHGVLRLSPVVLRRK